MKAWEEQWPDNLCGVASALTTLAPLPRSRVWQPWLMFWIRRVAGPPRPLAPLSFIYFARTALVTGIEPKRAYIYFESHFNGGFDEYIDVFSYVVPQHMKRIWSTADDFPGPKPSTRFNKYIREHEFGAAHFYSAYPKATVTDVGRALDLRDDLSRLANRADRADPEKFAKRWNNLWRPPAPPPSPGVSLASLFGTRDTNVVRKGRVYGLTVLHPIRDGRRDALAAAIAALGRDPSPFKRVHGTHFARLVLFDHWPFTARPHLLFSCIADGADETDIDAYVERLCASIPTVVDTVWGECAGVPESGSADAAVFGRWLRSRQLTTTTFFGPYGRATVHEVHQALQLRDQAQTLARVLQYDPPDVIHRMVRTFLNAQASALR
jgi:hypothetical protein